MILELIADLYLIFAMLFMQLRGIFGPSHIYYLSAPAEYNFRNII